MLYAIYAAAFFLSVSAQECGQIRVPGEYEHLLTQTFLSGDNPRDAIPGVSPWSMSLEYQEEGHVCGAVLIQPTWAITSASCVQGRAAADLQVIAGVVNRTSSDGTEQIIQVAEVVQHPGFDAADDWSRPNDLALLSLAEEADIAGRLINTICLPPSPDTKYWENPSSLVSGWGKSSVDDEEYPAVLQQAWIDVVRPAYCDLWWPEDTPVNHTFHQCVYDQVDRQVSICTGDEGSVLQSMVDGIYYLAGVASFYAANCGVRIPSVYSDIPTYLPWILEVIEGSNNAE